MLEMARTQHQNNRCKFPEFFGGFYLIDYRLFRFLPHVACKLLFWNVRTDYIVRYIPKAAIIKTSHVNLAIMLLFPCNLLLTTRLASIRHNFFLT
jgi:hypothetical protein